MPPPPASRRDESSPAAGHDGPPPPCDCGGCREAAAIYAEPRREYPPEQYAIDRALADEQAGRHGPKVA